MKISFSVINLNFCAQAVTNRKKYVLKKSADEMADAEYKNHSRNNDTLVKIKNASLSYEKEKLLLEKYSASLPLTYRELGEKYDLKITNVRKKVISAEVEMQRKNGSFSQEISNYISNYKKEFEKNASVGLTDEKISKMIEKNPQMLSFHPEIYKKRMQNLCNYYNGKLTVNDCLKIAEKYPQIFLTPTKTIITNIEGLTKRFEKEGFTSNDYLACIKKSAVILSEKPQTLEDNVRNLVKKFSNNGLTVNDYIKCVIRHPRLFYLSPNTIEKNIYAITEAFAESGLSVDDYIKCALKSPALLYRKPESIKKNIYEMAKELKRYHIDGAIYLKCAVKYPSLFNVSPEKIKQNIENTIELFNNSGLKISKAEYLKCAIKQPPLFYMSPERIVKNVRGVTEWFVNRQMDGKAYFDKCKKCPTLFCMKPERMIQRIYSLIFLVKNYRCDNNLPALQGKELMDDVLKNVLTVSVEYNYMRILNRKFSKILNKKVIQSAPLKPALMQMIESCEKPVDLPVYSSTHTESFLNFLYKFLKECGKENIVNIKLVV